mmetsp:Transcript_23833/g.31025  ORF Transcript_23833/g.31025 Transcript_23833/m.31025 type:complete len:180 (+) Transcript_23833:72-611(+)|eukprot:CAMPEP_0197290636 /NCGR_PEP_ID=MMETSP0890-20130614/8648_1 /TAXON_ID=44058 ORGANISM="Aureoumbra lagunensis, Strain CCMP1510" /NCGR_SAMPLE_ID=MMETSP0890 /ASSEMBLY_ACC=CAM_ASM_000533 /LENGTH=179 /DNA_ID=CAMNT_0042762749 /DNA_START=57 /DNA_END=596 /DNA_ORIENTATION=+
MPIFVAYLKGDFENIDKIETKTSTSVWTIDLKHGQGDEVRKGVTIDAEDVIELEGSRGTAHLVLKFADANEKAQVSIITPEEFRSKYKNKKNAMAHAPRALTADDSGSFVPVLAFEARGADVINLSLGGDNFIVTATSGTVFETDLDFSEGDWSDYDDQAELPVSLTNIETKVDVLRQL